MLIYQIQKPNMIDLIMFQMDLKLEILREMNTDGATYIFMAFAESPFQTANAK